MNYVDLEHLSFSSGSIVKLNWALAVNFASPPYNCILRSVDESCPRVKGTCLETALGDFSEDFPTIHLARVFSGVMCVIGR